MNDPADDAVVQRVAEGPGRLLRETREAKNIGCREVAAYLRLAPWIIEALERDDYTRMPGGAFTRGYLRGYARYLGLPEAEVLESYDRLGIPEPEHLIAQPRVRTQLHSTDRRIRTVTYSVVALVLILSLLWWKDEIALRLWQPQVTAPAQVQLPAMAPLAADDSAGLPTDLPGQPYVVLSPDEQAAGDSEGAATPAPTQAAETPDPAAGSEVAVTAAVDAATDGELASPLPAPQTAVQATPLADSATPAPRAAAPDQSADAPRDTLVLRFAEDSWVEIRDGDGKRVLHGLMQANETRTVRGKPPFRLVLGNATGVSVEFNGQPFDTSPFRTGRVARFTLGTPDHSE